jgi:hypothetical protein
MKNYFAFAQFCSGAGRKAALALCQAFCTLGLGVSTNAEGRKGKIIPFDAPGADSVLGSAQV